ncbi:multiple sugar transport system permease protein [Kribbella steppae]|uniref:Multiple sugar transport system permease protein n=1 Tax=Kribbella steppae TaxID=2512223 RepID=A0A4R2GWH5_9ACTN|nr:sugar ABC transporter permease [Kribbella steppae]TCO15391.1 multiple sugar transport system permease protein [Kribbella steppae]
MSLTETDRPALQPPATRRPVSGRRRWSGRTALVLLAFMLPAIVFVGVFTYYPLLSGIQMAFRNYNLNDLSDTSWVGLDNFRTLLDDQMFRGTVANSIVWVVGSLVPQFLIGFAMAMWLRRRFRFRGAYQALVFFPWAVSGFLIGILFRWMFNGEFGVVNDLLMKSHLIDTPVPWLADARYAMVSVIIANVWYGVTFFAIMILAALQGVPEELYEAAAIDGAGKVRTLFSITIPSIRTTLALTVLLRVIWIFNSPELIFGMTGGGPANETHIVTSYMIQVTQEGDYGRASAMGVMVVFVLMLFAVFYLMAIRPRPSRPGRKGLA